MLLLHIWPLLCSSTCRILEVPKQPEVQYLSVMMRTVLNYTVQSLPAEAGKWHHNLLGLLMMLLKLVSLPKGRAAGVGEEAEALLI